MNITGEGCKMGKRLALVVLSLGIVSTARAQTYCANDLNYCSGFAQIGSFSCNGNTYRVLLWMYQKATKQPDGSYIWTDDVITAPSHTVNPDFYRPYQDAYFLQGNPNPSSISSLPMSQGNGLLYLSQNVAMRLTRYSGFGQILVDEPVTLLGGNLQYFPADGSHPHGSWATWISAPYDPGHGICGNMAFSWSTPTPFWPPTH